MRTGLITENDYQRYYAEKLAGLIVDMAAQQTNILLQLFADNETILRNKKYPESPLPLSNGRLQAYYHSHEENRLSENEHGHFHIFRMTSPAEKDKAVKFFKEGMAEFIDGNYDNSIERLSRAIELEPNHKLALMSRGAGYMKTDRAKDAMADYNRVIEIDPDYPRAYHLRGLAHDRSGDPNAALHDINRAIEIDPAYGAAYYSRANLHAKLGEEILATEDIQVATSLTQVNIETFANDNNIWRSQHMKIEEMGVADTFDR